MGTRPGGSVLVINVDPECLPETCGECRFFDYRAQVRRRGTGWDCVDEGLCRRHPPTTAGKLPFVSPDTVGCGDGIAGDRDA